MTILITGSVGKTAAPLAASLSASGIPILVTSRAPPENPTYPTARFDWMDASTYSIPFTHEVASKSPITAAYLVGPMVLDCLEQLKAFVDYARKEQGVKRFVLLKYSAKEGGEPALREMGEWLEELGQKGEIQWCVLCPSWFMENFSKEQHFHPIKYRNEMYSATGDGKIPFVAAEDIAAVAHHALVDEKSHDCFHNILGSELLSYDDAATIFTKILGRDIKHVHMSKKDIENMYMEVGLPEDYAKVLGDLDTGIAKHNEEYTNDVIETVTGKRPVTLREFVQANEEVWLNGE